MASEKKVTTTSESKYKPTKNDKDGDGYSDWMTDEDKKMAKKMAKNLAKAVAKAEKEEQKKVERGIQAFLNVLGIK